MAEIGHPQIGPQSYWKLTYPEIRIYAEGFVSKNERQEDEQAYGQSQSGTSPTPNYDRDSKKKRDMQAVRKVQRQIDEKEAQPKET